MERYEGLLAGDHITGGGSYVAERGRGYEICNFSGDANTFYGYVQPPGSQIKINRIGANPDDDSINGVTVIWTAARPTGGTVVVGWYRNATVFRNYQTFSHAPEAHRRNRIDGYYIKAPSNLARLLPVDQRTLEIPRSVTGGMGQANVWYADNPKSKSIVKQVLDVVRGGMPRVSVKKGQSGKQDQERKAKIEKIAIRTCCEHFEAMGYTLESVEKDNVGWDLEATSGKSTLRIEVKGLSGSDFSVELTPNEYQEFSKKTASYRLAVVRSALKSPALSICRYSKEQGTWLVDDLLEQSLEIQVKQSASIKCI